MTSDELYISRCLQLAQQGLGNVLSNPLVGCVIVKDNKVIGEGYHREYGKNHAEINAIESVKDPADLKGSTLYVNLEPCSHFGKTPPCTDRIIESGISKVVIAGLDPSEKVNGKGVQKLEESGIEVVSGILKEGEIDSNRRFRTFHQKKRPYVILKWAQSKDGFIDKERKEGEKGQFRISNDATQRLLHLWRSQEMAIMVGKNTLLTDNPSLNVRLVDGRDPLRIVIDRKNDLPKDLKVFSDSCRTLVFNNEERDFPENIDHVQGKRDLPEILKELHQRGNSSLFVEGGGKLLQSFIDADLWDEIRIFESQNDLENGLKAPEFKGREISRSDLQGNRILTYRNTE